MSKPRSTSAPQNASDASTPSAHLLDIVRCPECHARLGLAEDGSLRCSACRATYPVVDGIPWLYRDVPGSRAQWAAKLQQFRTDLLAEHTGLESAAQEKDLLASTSDRLTRHRAGLERQGQQIFGLLAPFAFSHSEAGGGLPRDRIPSQQHVTSYLETAFRDWAWGAGEVRDAMEMTRSLLEPTPPDTPARALVLGGGAGGLSQALSKSGLVESVTQLDLNPLLTRIGAKVARGESVTLTELPRFPRALGDVAVDHTLAMPAEADSSEGFLEFVLGDIFAPPFEAETFGLLVTPWFVDILPESFRKVAKRLGALLGVGGRWVSFGPLSFESVDAVDRLTPEEMREAMEAAGFEIEETRMQRVDYLHSPHNMSRRGEELFIFSAIRREKVDVESGFAFYPEWMTDGSLPIPAIPEFERRRAEQIFDVEILKCIDGEASIEDIVTTLSGRYGLAPDRCRNTINRFFSKMIEAD